MNNYEFVKFAANRFGIDETLAESMVDMFAQSLQELISCGQSVTIDEIGEFKSIPLFPNGLNHHNNITPTVFKDSILVTDLMRVYQYGFGN